MEPDKERLIDRVRKLRAKGSDATTTEEEAEAFIAGAARLMAEHGLNDDDLVRAGIKKVFIVKRGLHHQFSRCHVAVMALGAIADFTGTAIHQVSNPRSAWQSPRWECGLSFTGRESDIQVADFCFDQVRNLVDMAWRKHAREIKVDDISPTKTQTIKRSFQIGMAMRIANRLRAMTPADRMEQAGRARKEMERMTPTLRHHGLLKSRFDIGSVHAGERAGESVSLGQGVNGGPLEQLRIEEA